MPWRPRGTGEWWPLAGRTGPEGIPTYKFGTDLDMGFHVLHTFFRGEHGFASKKQTGRLIEKIKEYDPDIIHLHNIHGFYLDVEQLFCI